MQVFIDCEGSQESFDCHKMIMIEVVKKYDIKAVYDWIENTLTEKGWLYFDNGIDSWAVCPVCRKELHD